LAENVTGVYTLSTDIEDIVFVEPALEDPVSPHRNIAFFNNGWRSLLARDITIKRMPKLEHVPNHDKVQKALLCRDIWNMRQGFCRG
jgi:hypothetical protein